MIAKLSSWKLMDKDYDEYFVRISSLASIPSSVECPTYLASDIGNEDSVYGTTSNPE